MLNSHARRLFLLGFLTLFLELALIRYLSGNVWNMGYFPNLVLMGVFLGMGIGFIFHHYIADKHSERVFCSSAFAILLLIIFVYRFRPSVPGFTRRLGSVGGEIYFTASPAIATGLLDYVVFVLILVFILSIFVLISQRTAKVFRMFDPLKAYTLDILGSCCGIVSFMVISWLTIPAYGWFCFVLLLYWLIQHPAGKKERLLSIGVLALVVSLVWLQDQRLLSSRGYDGPLDVTWSPYQKVEFTPFENGTGEIYVNGLGHQSLLTPSLLADSFYQRPYNYRRATGRPPVSDVLVIGAGSGNDVAVALQNGANHVDAIEIDPVIAQLGRLHHAARPYADSRVTLVIDDARAFMSYTRHRYDLIVFALTDSLVKVSPMAQLRLENYIFTEESIARASHVLNPGGYIVFYNYYRLPWVQDKIRLMSYDATGMYPRQIFQAEDFAEMVLAPGGPPDAHEVAKEELTLPHDDWPFLYLKARGIPTIYRNAMITMATLILLLAIVLHTSTRSLENAGRPAVTLKLAFVFMGAAFLLLETKSVIQFSLLFGTTWLNNSLVFLAVLLFVLAANWTATLLKGKWVIWTAFALLQAFCALAYLYPLGRLLDVENVAARFVAASFLTFASIFFANVIFSVTFRDTEVPEHLFGWNLIGAAFGGVLEYSSLALGYNALTLVVAACYFLVFVLLIVSSSAKPTPVRAT